MNKNVEKVLDIVIVVLSLAFAICCLWEAIDMSAKHNFGFGFVKNIAGLIIGYFCAILFIKEV